MKESQNKRRKTIFWKKHDAIRARSSELVEWIIAERHISSLRDFRAEVQAADCSLTSHYDAGKWPHRFQYLVGRRCVVEFHRDSWMRDWLGERRSVREAGLSRATTYDWREQ